MTLTPSSPGRLTHVTWTVAALAVVGFVLKPEHAWSWLLAVAVMAAIRLVVGGLSRSRRSDAQRRALRNAGAWGGLLLGTGLVVAVLRAIGLEDGWMAERPFGIVTGLMLLVMGNAIPKSSVAPVRATCLHGTYAIRRFAGWMFAAAGAIGLSAWLFAPVRDAEVIATVACFSAVALVVVRCLARPDDKVDDYPL